MWENRLVSSDGTPKCPEDGCDGALTEMARDPDWAYLACNTCPSWFRLDVVAASLGVPLLTPCDPGDECEGAP